MPAKKTIRVLLADDHHIVRQGIRASLLDHAEILVIAEAANGKVALQKTKELSPDVVLMDLNMPEMGGLEATKLISQRFPNTKVIALTVHDNAEYVSEILSSGAQGYLLKNTTPEQLVAAIKSVAEGAAFFSPSVSLMMLEQYKTKSAAVEKNPITRREKEVLALIVAGDSNKEISSRLDIGVRTVETHRARMMKKFSARNSVELCRIALEQKLVNLKS